MAHFDGFDEINLQKPEESLQPAKPQEQAQPQPEKPALLPFSSASTLEEPVSRTLVASREQGRELRSVWQKTKITFARGDKNERLKELLRYDLWGPFAFFLVFAA